MLVTNAENAERVRALELPVEHVLVLDDDLIAGGDPASRGSTRAADDPAQLYYTSGTTGLAKGILHAHRYLLAHNEFELCHDVQDGERFHGMGEWAWVGRHRAAARAVAVRGRAGRLRARGRLRRAQAARIPLEVPGDERLQHADRDPLDDGDRRRRDALPAAVPHRLRRRRAAEPGGDPLVPRPVRRHGPRLLRPLRELPAVRELPVHGRARGLDGAADAGLGRRDPRRGRAAAACRRARRDLPARAQRTRTTRSGTGTTRRRRARPSTASGSTRRTLRAWTRTATSGTRAAPTT